MDDTATIDTIRAALARRFGEDVAVPDLGPGAATIATMAARGAVRAFTDEPVARDLLRLLAAVALSSPTKSDLQQRDVVIVEDEQLRVELHDIIRHRWLDNTPAFFVFLGNNRRQRQIHDWRGKRFANDHLDAFFNASVDAAIALSACVTAAEAVGLGACPISQIRNDCERVSKLLNLPDHVFPLAGLALGWPAEAAPQTPRLPLGLTVHTDRFDETHVATMIDGYDRRREEIFPYARQRDVASFGEAESYGWSEEKARHYSRPEREGFGRFVRAKGFNLD